MSDGLLLCGAALGEATVEATSKRRDRPYQGGRSKYWVKVKNRKHPAMSRVMEAFGWPQPETALLPAPFLMHHSAWPRRPDAPGGSAHFDGHWRVRPALALLAPARDPWKLLRRSRRRPLIYRKRCKCTTRPSEKVHSQGAAGNDP